MIYFMKITSSENATRVERLRDYEWKTKGSLIVLNPLH